MSDGEAGAAIYEYRESALMRFSHFGFPAGLAFFMSIAALTVTSLDAKVGVVLIAFSLAIGVSAGAAALAAHRLRVLDNGLEVWTAIGIRRLIPWGSFREIQLVPPDGNPEDRRLLHLVATAPRAEVFVFDSIDGFEAIDWHIRMRAKAARVGPMRLWQRIVLLQW